MYGFIYDGVYQYEDFDKDINGKYILRDNITINGANRNTIQPGDAKYRDLNNDKLVNDTIVRLLVVVARSYRWLKQYIQVPWFRSEYFLPMVVWQ
jgi:hypothetical protein